MSGSSVQTITGPNGVLLAVVPDDTKVDLRRLMGFPAYGYGVTGFFEMDLYLQVYETMELRLNSLTESEYSRITSLYLPNCLQLEADLYNMRNTINIGQAAVYTRNPSELKDRENMLRYWRLELCNFLGLQPGPNMKQSSNTFRIRI